MGFLVDHHWYVTYQIAEWFEETFWWVQLAGAVLSVIAGIGMAKTLTTGWRYALEQGSFW
jgi:hypothetical protein